MPLPPIGVLTVACPRCRAAVGRPCHSRRGWLQDAHRPRVLLWQQEERREARQVSAEAPCTGPGGWSGQGASGR